VVLDALLTSEEADAIAAIADRDGGRHFEASRDTRGAEAPQGVEIPLALDAGAHVVTVLTTAGAGGGIGHGESMRQSGCR
jgi:hypothetical protein